MRPSQSPRVKICCISSVAEARCAIRLGADALGLVSSMPSGPGVIDDALIAAIARVVPPPIATFLLTSEQNAEAIISDLGWRPSPSGGGGKARLTTLGLVGHGGCPVAR